MISKYGKSAVDATRRNTLPLYLDEALTTGLGTKVSAFDVILNKDEWVTREDSSLYQAVAVNLDSTIESLMIFPDHKNPVEYAQAGIYGEFNENDTTLLFTAVRRPTINLRVIILAVGARMAAVLPSADNIAF